MPISEIDEIFASKPKAKEQIVSTEKQQPITYSSSIKSKKKGKKKGSKEDKPPTKHDAQLASSPKSSFEPSKAGDGQRKRKAPDVVIDPSFKAAAPKRKKVSAALELQGNPRSHAKSQKGQDSFSDSRGTGSRRRTEEGWNVYKEDELGISTEGGDTPLCPFDCDCCF